MKKIFSLPIKLVKFLYKADSFVWGRICAICVIIYFIILVLMVVKVWSQTTYPKRIAHLANQFDESFDSIIDIIRVDANVRDTMRFDDSLLPVDTFIILHEDTVYSRQVLYYYAGESKPVYGPIQMIYKRVPLDPVDVRYGFWLYAPDTIHGEEMDLFLVQVYADTILRNALSFISGFPIDTLVMLGRDSTYNLFFYYSYVGYGTLDGGELIVPHKGLNAILGPVDSNVATVYSYVKWPSGQAMEGAMVSVIPSADSGKFYDSSISPKTFIARTAMVAFTDVDGVWQIPLKWSASYADTVYYQVTVTDSKGDVVEIVKNLYVPSIDTFNIADTLALR